MGKFNGLKEGDAMTAEVNDDSAEVDDVLVLAAAEVAAGAEVEDVLPLVGVEAADVRPPPDCKMLKPGNAGGMEEADVVEIGKSVGAVAAVAPRVAVRSSGEIGWCWWPAALLLNAPKAGFTADSTADMGAGGGGRGNDSDKDDEIVLVVVATPVEDGRLATTAAGLLLVGTFLLDSGREFSPGVDARVGENSN